MNPSGLVWNLDLEASKFDSKLKKASSDAKQAAKSIDHDVSGIGTKMTGAFSAVGGAISGAASQLISFGVTATKYLGTAALAATGFAVKSAASFEQTRIGLENMLGSADAARKVLSDVSKFAAETPFEFPELAGAVKQLVAFGFTGEDAVTTMKQLGDVSAAVGAPMGDIAYLMGTLKTQGRAMTIDIRQFAQRGIPIYEYLAKTLKTTEANVAELVTAGKVGFPEVQAAFKAMTGEGGKFQGAMATQSKSLSGLFSTLKDNIGQTARELVGITQEGDIKSGSLFDKLRIGTAELIKNLPVMIDKVKQIINDVLPTIMNFGKAFVEVGRQVIEYLQPKLKVLWDTVKESLPTWQQFWHEVLAPLAVFLGTVFVAALGLTVDWINFILSAITPLIQFLMDHEWVWWSLVTVLGYVAGAMALNGAMNALTIAFHTMQLVTIPSLMASWSALTALISLPVIVPAFIIAAAIVSINAIKNAWNAVLDAKNAASNLAPEGQMRNLQEQATAARARGDQATADRLGRTISALAGNAEGTDFWKGGPTWVGERGPEIVNLPRGAQVIPNHELGGAGGISIGVVNISSEVDGERWIDRLTRRQTSLQSGLTSNV